MDVPSPTDRPGPLAGIVVADFSRVLAGPYATMLLADLGADVIKVEGPGGDDTRSWVPPTRDDVGTYYLAVNRNKRSVVLDLKDTGDRALAHELSARADVFIQNFKPGGLARFGLDYESVRGRNERIIYCSISGFGADKGANLPGYDLLVQGMSGLMSLTGAPDGPPFRSGISVFDVMTGLHSVIGVLAALHHRDLTGQGQHIETNLLSSALSALVNQSSAYVAGGVVPARMGNAHLSLFPYEPLATGDGELIVVAGNDGQFRRLAETIGRPELADDPRFDTVGRRNDNREQLRPLLLEALSARTAQEWFGLFTAAGLPSGPINTVQGGVELAESLGLQPVVQVGEAQVPSVRNPIRLSATPPDYRYAPPALDEQGEELRRWLREPRRGSDG
ncbi:CaiB/BaiF CoA transferase family protein [Nakamurella multipartita]|uniref:L-carnitine dehydratase/bile acid-inducible protein F n=1 Tax=Nakamurella multipartita (strain ATCC 700099 / DSM 44233 / CIP 104796 / JCM 9543 / NBRC 105858 / Y-104) TaxID=479431 RepID=C8XHZ1_NAKMY|nr:CoA transferase [Nakamurella multipartita]ACV76482.1 L-carnitine dehydratase/bile acid-inducible protein F [Nakamurella multipartita DSM 44233]